MFWIILFAIFLISFIVILTIKKSFFSVVELLLIVNILLMPMTIAINEGMKVYPELVGLRAEAISLKSEIETIKNAYYNNNKEISLENFNQSAVLSKYISKYATTKAQYNQKLAIAVARRHNAFLRWFAESAFIDKKIEELDYL